MKVGVVWNHPSSLGECSFRFESYLEGLEALGHDGIVVCTRGSDHGLEVPRVAANEAKELETVGFWRSLALDAALVVTWHRMSHVLGALNEAGTRVVSIADTDGLVGFADHPLATWTRLMAHARGPRMKLRAVRYWLREWRRSLLGRSALDREVVESTRASDAVVQGNQRSRQHLTRFLGRRGAADLAARIRVAPFAIAAPFLSVDVKRERSDRVAVVGRWTDPQKDAKLVARVLERFLACQPGAEALVVGEHDEHLAALAARHPRASHLGLVTFEALAQELARCRVLFFASRWEGSPHAAFEALAVGATVVGPRIPCFLSWAEDEDFGTVASGRSAGSLLRALLTERQRWERGERRPAAIAGEWRERLNPAEICCQMLRERSGDSGGSEPGQR